MGTVGDGKNSRGSSGRTTHRIGGRYGAGDAIEDFGTDDCLHFSDTMLVNGTSSIEDSFETQLVDLDEETQLVDLAGETQFVDLDEETQLVDLAGETQLVDLEGETQLVDLAGETQPVDIAGETQLVDDFPIEFLNDTDMPHNHPSKQGGNERQSGPTSKGFTSIRAASIRASGLAAHAKGSHGISRAKSKDNSSLLGSLFESGQHSQNMNIENDVRQSYLKTYKVGGNAVRKLFDEDDNSEHGLSEDDNDNNMDENPGMPEIPTSENCLAELSCAVSQEPGELSQAQALGVVDKFLNLNATEIEESFRTRVCNVEKSKVASSLKGSLNFAKSYIYKSTEKQGIYDWDNTREDNSGGEFFRKNKKLIFEKGRTEPRKTKRPDTESVHLVGNNYDKKDHTENKLGGTACSDSRLLLYKLRARTKSLNGEDEVFCKSIFKNLDEQLKEVSESELTENIMCDNANDVGPDTQTAAKAMEDLCFEVQLDDNNNNCVRKKGAQTLEKATRKSSRTAPSEEWPTTKKPYSTSAVVTRQRKRVGVETNNKSSFSPEQSNKKKKGDKVAGSELAENIMCNNANGVGPDTQIAAEAMEDLCFEVQLDDNNNNCVGNEGAHTLEKATRKSSRTAPSEERATAEKLYPTSAVVTRQRKRAGVEPSNKSSVSPEQSKKRKKVDMVSGSELAEDIMHNNANGVGPDTQIAAEAMEDLCFEVQLDDNNSNCVGSKGAHTLEKATRKSSRTAPSEERPTAEKLYPTTAVVTRQRKRAGVEPSNKFSVSREQSKERKKGDKVLGEVEKSKIDKMESASEKYAAKSHSKGSLECSVPVAHQTRIHTELNCPAAPTNAVNDGMEINDMRNVQVSRKKRTPTKPRNAKIITIEQLKKYGFAALNRSNRTSVSASSALNTDAAANGHRKRSHQEALAVGHEDAKTNGGAEASTIEMHGTSNSTCRTPVNCATPIKKASPICIGDEYYKQSCRMSLSKQSLIKEINSLASTSPGMYIKELRKRKDITRIKVLFSQHLDDDVVKHQKKVLSRLGGAVALCMSEATHFVADEFVRTRNMLEAIAGGKPVVTHLWLESCGQANCLIDEKNHILRDAKKEKEFGFSLPVSLSRACQQPLLEGQKVYITPNTKPGKEVLTNLVKVVGGLLIERLGRSVWKDEKAPDDLLILSCEDDYDECIPFLEKGGPVYSSELLLNGIVKQKLEHERHRIFTDNVKRTRSTMWVKKKNQYLPVTKMQVNKSGMS